MKKAKKLTISMYENRQLKKVEGIKIDTYPFYLMMTFNRKNKTIKSLTFETLINLNFLDTEKFPLKDQILMSDIRFFNNLRKVIEEQGSEFSLNFTASDNSEYESLKGSLILKLTELFKSKLMNYLSDLEICGSMDYLSTRQILSYSQNIFVFWGSLLELNSELFNYFEKTNPELFNDFYILADLLDYGIVLFQADLLAKDPLTRDLKVIL